MTPLRGQAIFTQINQVRAAHKLPPLVANPSLVKAAQLKADDMVTGNYFSHKSPAGKGLWDFIGASKGKQVVAGENLARGYTDTESLQEAWLKSPKHLANILDKDFTETGIAIATGKDGKLYVSQYFGRSK